MKLNWLSATPSASRRMLCSYIELYTTGNGDWKEESSRSRVCTRNFYDKSRRWVLKHAKRARSRTSYRNLIAIITPAHTYITVISFATTFSCCTRSETKKKGKEYPLAEPLIGIFALVFANSSTRRRYFFREKLIESQAILRQLILLGCFYFYGF